MTRLAILLVVVCLVVGGERVSTLAATGMRGGLSD